jgi:hypothetical protein
MAKATEWGAAAILSISSYGAGAEAFYGSGTISISSTNNATGIYGLANGWEYVAGCYTSSSNTNTTYIYNAASKYKNVYGGSNNSSVKASPDGSALDLNGWLGASDTTWVNSTYPVFKRGDSGLFSFLYGYGNGLYSSRAVVVCGSGL